jgi:hypothetical protein
MYDIPILLIIYNRSQEYLPQVTVLRKIQPKEIYIYADGPKNTEVDKRMCDNARATLLNLIDWECNIATYFKENNSGCGKGPYEAISWFFSQIDAGIILEDDCIPSISFFHFCKELLIKYKNDTRVWQISGTNRLGKYEDESDYSYLFSNYPSEWGWATWKRAWINYDYKISLWKDQSVRRNLSQIYYKSTWRTKLFSIFEETYANNENISWWDYQWLFTKNINSGLSIVPKINLVSNIGTGDNATHTTDAGNKFMNLEALELPDKLIHPNNIIADYVYDSRILDEHFPLQKSNSRFVRRIKRWIKKLLKFVEKK